MVEEVALGTGAGGLALVRSIQADDGLRVANIDREKHQGLTSMSSPMSSTGAEFVIAPIEMQSAPVCAYARTVSRVMPPLTSRSGRRSPVSLASATAART